MKNIKLLRQERGITQEQLASKLHTAKSTIGMWENGKREPDIDNLKEIANFFNVSVDWLTGKSPFRDNKEASKYYTDWGPCTPYFNAPFDFCQLLIEIRQEQDVGIDEMAEAAGITATYYLECEEGIEPVTYEQAEKLCSVLGTNTSQVLFDNDFYDEEVPEEYHDDVRKWEILKKAAEDEVIREAPSDSEDIKIVARHLAEIPSDKRESLIKTINSTIDMYKEAMGIQKREG